MVVHVIEHDTLPLMLTSIGPEKWQKTVPGLGITVCAVECRSKVELG